MLLNIKEKYILNYNIFLGQGQCLIVILHRIHMLSAFKSIVPKNADTHINLYQSQIIIVTV